MKKMLFSGLFVFLLSSQVVFAADASPTKYSASGQVLTVDPMYSQVTIRHGAIKGFGGDTDTQFYASSAELLKDIRTDDLVDFEFTDTKGDVQINKITKTGVAIPEKPQSLGPAVQEMFEGAGNVVKGVTEPLTPAHDVAGGVMDTATGATGNVLSEVTPDQQSKF